MLLNGKKNAVLPSLHIKVKAIRTATLPGVDPVMKGLNSNGVATDSRGTGVSGQDMVERNDPGVRGKVIGGVEGRWNKEKSQERQHNLTLMGSEEV